MRHGDVKMQQMLIPQLRITNAERNLAFYVDGLGFKVDWRRVFIRYLICRYMTHEDNDDKA